MSYHTTSLEANAALQRIASSIRFARAQNDQGLRLAIVIAGLIGLLLWRTQWPALQLGLWLLLLAQIVVVVCRVRHRAVLRRSLEQVDRNDVPELIMLDWFTNEKQFVLRLSTCENGLRAIGFLVLAYEFWRTTGQIWIALLLGIVYPAIAYLAMARRAQKAQVRRLEKQRHETELDLLIP